MRNTLRREVRMWRSGCASEESFCATKEVMYNVQRVFACCKVNTLWGKWMRMLESLKTPIREVSLRIFDVSFVQHVR